jgi:MFS family permease
LASLSWSAGSLIAFRVVQGFGGGMLEPTSLTLAAKAAGQHRVGRVMGILSLIINIAPVLGPLTGGLFANAAHWRWIFLINLPIGAAVLVAASFVLPRDRGSRDAASLDLRGLLLLSPGFVGVLLAIDRTAGTPRCGRSSRRHWAAWRRSSRTCAAPRAWTRQ